MSDDFRRVVIGDKAYDAKVRDVVKASSNWSVVNMCNSVVLDQWLVHAPSYVVVFDGACVFLLRASMVEYTTTEILMSAHYTDGYTEDAARLMLAQYAGAHDAATVERKLAAASGGNRTVSPGPEYNNNALCAYCGHVRGVHGRMKESGTEFCLTNFDRDTPFPSCVCRHFREMP